MSQSISQSALVPYTAEQMFQLVADIEAYPDFLNWCAGTQVLERGKFTQDNRQQVIARVDINFRGVKQSFTTCNQNQPPHCIALSLHESTAFKQMQGQWRFLDLGAGCKISFELDFAIHNRLLASMVTKVFSTIANTQIDSFVKRAQQLYPST